MNATLSTFQPFDLGCGCWVAGVCGFGPVVGGTGFGLTGSSGFSVPCSKSILYEIVSVLNVSNVYPDIVI